MVQKGTASVAINEITEAADVGSGSFYNHFESKEAIYTALTDEVFEEFGNALDRLADGLSDPAEVISYCMRHTLLRAHREPHWGRFLAREGLCALAPSCGLGQRLLRDVQRGIASNRFSVADPLMAIISLGGTALAAIATDLKMAQSADPQAPAVRHLGFSSSYFAERAATVALQTLGIRRAEANRIAKQPLPAVDW
jgi:AcrR family transcriptional regulator